MITAEERRLIELTAAAAPPLTTKERELIRRIDSSHPRQPAVSDAAVAAARRAA